MNGDKKEVDASPQKYETNPRNQVSFTGQTFALLYTFLSLYTHFEHLHNILNQLHIYICFKNRRRIKYVKYLDLFTT